MTKPRFSACLLVAVVAVLLGATESRAYVFGHQTVEASTVSLDQQIVGGVFTCDSTGIGDSITLYIDFGGIDPSLFECALFLWNDGTNPSWVASTVQRSFDPGGDGWHGFAFSDPKPYLAPGRYVICGWGTVDGSSSGSLRVKASSTGDTVCTDAETYSAPPTWPDPLVKTNLDNYVASIYCTYTPCTKMVLSDSASLCLGQIAPASASSDTAYANADGDIVTLAASSGADYTCVDEVTPNDATDYLYTIINGRATYVDLDPDTTFAGTLDSVRIVIRGQNSETESAGKWEIKYDVSGTDIVLDTLDLPAATTWTTKVSRPITGLTRANLLTLEIGAKSIIGAGDWETGNLQVTWMVLQIFASASAQDVWADSLLKIGSVKATHAQRETRMLLSIRDTDSIGYYNPDGEGFYTYLAYLKIQTDSIKPATTRYLVPRTVVGQSNGEPKSPAVKWAAEDDAAYAHSNWSYWSSTDTAWGVAGADSNEMDWCYQTFFDSVAVTQNGTITVNITPWIQSLSELPDSIRYQGNGMLLFLSQEDSASNAWVKFGNVQPFANVDSTWIEIYRIPSDRIQQETSGEVDLGLNATPTSGQTIRGTLRGAHATALSSGTLIKVSAYIYSASGTTSTRAAVYDSAATIALLDTSAAQSVSSTGWKTYNVVGGNSIVSGHRYAMVLWGNVAGTTATLGRQAKTGHLLYYKTQTYGAWSNPLVWAGATNAYRGTIYLTYSETGVGGAATRRRRVMGVIGDVEFDVSEDSLKYVLKGAP